MKIVFRVDASITMGTGHVMRCRTLATVLKKQGADIQFITRAHPGHLGDMLARDGFTVILLPPPVDIENKVDDYAAWLGVSQQEDADQTIAAFAKQPCDWLIVDHYGLDRFWEALLQSLPHKLMVIDDLANRPHECDVLLDQNYSVAGRDRYQPWVPAHCCLLLGPRYALLRPEYAQYRKTMVPRTDDIGRVLVFMGGADNFNMTGKVLSALSVEQLAHLELDVVIGPNFVHKAEVTNQANTRPNTHIHGTRPHLADLMAKADLAIGAGGATTWERCYMRLPSIVITIAENQRPSISTLHEQGYVVWAGDASNITSKKVTEAVVMFLTASHKKRLVSCSELVDGKGLDRTVQVLLNKRSGEL